MKPTVMNMLLGQSLEGHMYIGRIKMSEVPETDEGAEQWLRGLYQKKVSSNCFLNLFFFIVSFQKLIELIIAGLNFNVIGA